MWYNRGTMKLTKKNRVTLVTILLFGLLIGTLSWEVLERIVALSGKTMDLSVGPVGFDVHVLSVWIRINPGSFLGTVAGILLFNRL